jgi:serine/threonine protein phosphatase PrpC
VLVNNPSKPNQDSFLVEQVSEKSYLFAVADGHGSQGHHVSQLSIKRLL